MKTNLQIELSDSERKVLANLIDGKSFGKRLISRKEVVAICQQHIAGLVESHRERESVKEAVTDLHTRRPDLYQIDEGDRALMARPDDPGYVRGWNLVKRRSA